MKTWAQEKPEVRQVFWTAMTTIYFGGLLLYFVGVKPHKGFASEIIPVGEPTAIDWAELGGIMFLT